MDFPSSWSYLYWLADVYNPGERILQSSRFSSCILLLLDEWLNSSALTIRGFRG
jgi:hypothetical protein